MKAVLWFMNNALEGNGRMAESTTKTDIRKTARNIAQQENLRIMDIIFEDSPHFENYRQLC